MTIGIMIILTYKFENYAERKKNSQLPRLIQAPNNSPKGWRKFPYLC